MPYTTSYPIGIYVYTYRNTHVFMTACIQTRSSRSCSPTKIQFQKIAQTRKYYIDAPVHASYDGYTATCRSFSFPVYKTRFECFYSFCQPAGGEVKKKKKIKACGTHPMRYTFLSILLASPVENTTDFTGHRCSKTSLGITVARWFSGENFETPSFEGFCPYSSST